jgi:4-hydroxy-3-polyprenylbenzoate decarboxylase
VNQSSAPQSVTLAITGASGTAYALRLLQVLLTKRIQVHLVLSDPGRISSTT